MDRQSTAKTVKIGSLENFRPYGNYSYILLVWVDDTHIILCVYLSVTSSLSDYLVVVHSQDNHRDL